MAQFKVVVTDYEYASLKNEKEVLSKLDIEIADYHYRTEEEVMEVTEDADAVIVQYAPITRKVIENLKKCKVISRYAVGVDNIDIAAATERGICVTNSPDYGIEDVSDHAVMLMLAITKKLVLLNNSVKSGRWDYKIASPVYRMRGRKLGLVGFGRIPRLVAEKARVFGLDIYAYDPYVDKDAAQKYGAKLVDFDTLIGECDYISIHVPLTKETKGLFNKDVFKKMKKGSYIINTARGPIIDTNALTEALDKGYLCGAALDVTDPEPINPDSPLLEMDNCIITPHSAWYSVEGQKSLQTMTAEQVLSVLSGYYPKNLVNPEVKNRLQLKQYEIK